MTIQRLIQYCLQYLEPDIDSKILEEDIESLKENDSFAEYINNIEHSIYMGLTRYAASNVLPLKELQLNKNTIEIAGRKKSTSIKLKKSKIESKRSHKYYLGPREEIDEVN